jgi:hypothetical protein
MEGRPDSAPSSSLVTQSDAPTTVNAARRHGFDAVLRRLCLESTSISAQKLDSQSYATAVFIGGNARFSLLTTRDSTTAPVTHTDVVGTSDFRSADGGDRNTLERSDDARCGASYCAEFGTLMTRFLISVMSSIAKMMPSRPRPLSLTPP